MQIDLRKIKILLTEVAAINEGRIIEGLMKKVLYLA